jgi:nucleotide-binding universal stress UspA family protein
METQDPQSRSPIVAAFSPGSAAREPLEFGLAASRVTGAPLVIVAVRHGGPLMHSRGGDVEEGDDDRTIEHLRTGLERRGLRDVEVVVFEDNTAARGLARAVDELDPELIVLGSTRRGKTGSALLGTTAERVIHSSSCPVAVVPNGYEPPEGGVKLIGAAYSSTDEGREALHAAASLAPAVAEAARGRLGREQELRDAVAQEAGDLDVDVDILVNDAADGLVAASEQVDLLVMGSRGLGPKRAVVLGSVSRKVVDRAACPVLVLPRGASAKTEALLADAEAQAGTRG